MHITDGTTSGYFGLKSLDYFATDKFAFELPYYCILVQWQGYTEIEMDGSAVTINANEVYCLSPNARIVVLNAEGSHSLYLFNKQFYCVELHDAEASCNGLLFNAAFPGPKISLNETEQRAFALLHQVFIDELKTNDSIQAEMIRVLLKRLIIKCARLVKEQLLAEKSLDLGQTDTIREFNAMVEKKFREWHQVQQYADALFKSPKTLSNLFGRYANETPLAVIHGRIAIEARRLLHYTDKSAKEIAFDLGFEDAAAFSKLFKKQVGLRPSQFREKKPGKGKIDNK